MFLKTLDEKQKFNQKNLELIFKIGWHLDLHGKMNLKICKMAFFGFSEFQWTKFT